MYHWDLLKDTSTIETPELIDTFNEGEDVIDTASPAHLSPLDDHGLILIKGEDAESFLQGQCTCDFRLLKENKILLGAHCNPKGRMISSFQVATLSDDCVGLRVHNSVIETACAELQKYSVFSKADVSIENRFAIFCIMGAKPSAVHDILKMIEPLYLHPKTGEFFHSEKLSVLNHSAHQLEVWMDADILEAHWNAIREPFRLADKSFWQYKQIQNGIAEVKNELIGKLLPQDINFQLVGGISFDKGCYTGQEIIARMHYRGTLKKHMYRAAFKMDGVNDFEIRPGQAIYQEGKDEPVGVIINFVEIGSGYFYLLTLVNDKVAQSNNATLSRDSLSNLEWLPLPYAIN